jgi:hypothetical protein
MSNGQRDDSVHFIEETEEETELGTDMEACTLQTVSQSKESEKGKGDSKSSLLGPGSLFCGFCHSVLSLNRGEGSAVQWEGGITFSNKIWGTDGFCNEGPGQDDEGRGGNTAPRTKYGWMV